MGTRAKISKVYLKDVYEKVQSGELTKYEFQQWLTTYAYKHYNKGMDAIRDICDDILRKQKNDNFDVDGRC
jgi:thiaminase